MARDSADPPPPGAEISGDGEASVSRRSLLLCAGTGALGCTALLASVGAARSLFPRVHHAPPSAVVLGKPGDFVVGVDERWKETHKLVLVREASGFYALRAVCTHLGCIPRWQQEQRTFRCPCHGSAFTVEGINVEGPAPRPLERLKITLDHEGQIVVDTQTRFHEERGQWSREGAYLAYAGRAPATGKAGG